MQSCIYLYVQLRKSFWSSWQYEWCPSPKPIINHLAIYEWPFSFDKLVGILGIMADIRQIYGWHMADIQLTYGCSTADIRQIYGGYVADIRQIYGQHTANIRLTYAGYAAENWFQVFHYELVMRPIYTTDMRLTYAEYTADIRPKTDSKIMISLLLFVWWPWFQFLAVSLAYVSHI